MEVTMCGNVAGSLIIIALGLVCFFLRLVLGEQGENKGILTVIGVSLALVGLAFLGWSIFRGT